MHRRCTTRLKCMLSAISVTICLFLLVLQFQESDFLATNVAAWTSTERMQGERLQRRDERVEGKTLTPFRGNSRLQNSSADISISSPYGAIDRGVPRSGTTLMRAMLDVHPDVRCGEETSLIPEILDHNDQWHRSENENNRLLHAGITDDVLNKAISSFILLLIAGHDEPARRLCNKDPLAHKHISFLSELFPNAKFIFMIRDGRATVHSIITRKIPLKGFDLADYRQCLEAWNDVISTMNQQCDAVGENCLKVRYEELVLHPEPQLRRILRFLDLPWNAALLRHEEYVGKQIKLSNIGSSSDQVVKPVNIGALSKWAADLPKEVMTNNMAEIAPMLETLGYDPRGNPPNYGTPDAIVLQKSEDVNKNADKWLQKSAKIKSPLRGK